MVGGGAPGDCTLTPGILAQFEVEDLLNSGITATLDSNSETFWIDTEVGRLIIVSRTFSMALSDFAVLQNSLFTFDQQETWAYAVSSNCCSTSYLIVFAA